MTNITKMMILLYDRVENTVEKGENAGNQHFLLFPQCFPRPSSLGSLKVGLCGKELTFVFCVWFSDCRKDQESFAGDLPLWCKSMQQ